MGGLEGQDKELRSPTLVSLHLNNRRPSRSETLVRLREDDKMKVGSSRHVQLILRDEPDDLCHFLQEELRIFHNICSELESSQAKEN